MLKKILIIALLLVGFPSVAQKIVFGVKGGVNNNSIGTFYHIGTASGGGSNLTPPEDTFYDPNQVIGTQFGAFAMFKWRSIFIRPEINITKKENEYPLALKTSYWEQNSTDFSVLFGLNVWKPINIYAGPSFSSISDMTMTGAEDPIIFKSSATNFQAGFLLDFKWFGLDLRYEYGFDLIPEQRVDILRVAYGTNVGTLLEYNQSTIYLTAHINLLRLFPGQNGSKPKARWRGKNCL